MFTLNIQNSDDYEKISRRRHRRNDFENKFEILRHKSNLRNSNVNLKTVDFLPTLFPLLKKSENSKYYFSIFFKLVQCYNSMNLKFFNSNYDNKLINNDETIEHHKKNTYFKNVHLFVNKIKNMTNSRDSQFIKDNLWFNL